MTPQSLPPENPGASTTQGQPNLRVVLWDMDGTLVDTEPYWIAAETALLASFGQSWTYEEALGLVGQSLWHSAGILRDAGAQMNRRQIIDTLTVDVVDRVRKRIPWRPGARELLVELRAAGIRCALVTMSEGPLAEEVLAALPENSFDFMITGDQVEHGKPHPEPYLKAFERFAEAEEGLVKYECLALEDSVPGTESALAAGLPTIGIPHTVPLPDDSRRVTWDSLDGKGIPDLLEALESGIGRQ